MPKSSHRFGAASLALAGVVLSCAASASALPVRAQSVTLLAVKSGPATATVGASVTYTVDVTANGGDATGVALTEFAPANLSLTGASVPGGTCFGDAISRQCNVGSILSGTTVTFTINGTAGAAGVIANQVSVSASNAPGVTSNTVNTTVTVSGPPPPPPVPVSPIIPVVDQSADVYLTLAGPSSVVAGDLFPGYAITVGDNGPVTAIAPYLSLSGTWAPGGPGGPSLGPALIVVPTGISCDQPNYYLYICKLPDLGPGQSLTIRATLKSSAGFNPDATGEFGLHGGAWASNPDPYEANNYAPAYSQPFTTTFRPFVPQIANVLPRSGAPGAAVTITGSQLDGITAVRFNGTPALIGARSTGMLSTAVPSRATTGELIFGLADGTTEDAGLFTVTAPPVIHCPAGMACTGGVGNHELFCSGGSTCRGGPDTTMLQCSGASSCTGGPAVAQESCSGRSECESATPVGEMVCRDSSICLPWGGVRQLRCDGGSVCRVIGMDARAACGGGSYCTGAPGARLQCTGSVCVLGGAVAECGGGVCSLGGHRLSCTAGRCRFDTRDGMTEMVTCNGGEAMVDGDPQDEINDCRPDPHPPVNLDDAEVSLAEAIRREELAISPEDVGSREQRNLDIGKALVALHEAQSEIRRAIATDESVYFSFRRAEEPLKTAIAEDDAALARRGKGLVQRHIDEALVDKREVALDLATIR